MKTLLACLLLSLCAPAFATDVQIACTAPTKFTDGSTITTAITYKFFGALQGQPKVLLNATARTSCANTWAAVPAGTVCVEATAIVGAVESAHTVESCINVAAPTPQPPGGPTLTIVPTTPIAYKLRQAVDGMSLVAIGTLAPQTACDPSQSVNGYFRVPRSAVKLASKYDTLPLVAFALCS